MQGFSPIASGFTAETDWLLEGAGFEPSVPLYGELGALGRVRRDPRRHREARNARPCASTRSVSDLRHAWGWFEICRDDRIVGRAKAQIADERGPSLIRAKLSLIARFNSL